MADKDLEQHASDVDFDRDSIHHTLGVGPTQAAPGNHNHEGSFPVLSEILLAVYPVGSIYMSVVSTNPGTIFGGTWVAWGAGRVPISLDGTQTEFDTVEETGGSKTKVLVAANLPPHAHGAGTLTAASNGSHDHDGNTSPTDGSAGAVIRQGSLSDDVKSNAMIDNDGAHTHDVTGSTDNGPGTSTAVNILQPYIVCYMFKRTA